MGRLAAPLSKEGKREGQTNSPESCRQCTGSVARTTLVLGCLEMVRLAIVAIDSVHSDGTLPRIPVKLVGGRRQQGGYTRDGIQAVRITINSRGKSPGLSMIHEVGHFIDHQSLGHGMFATEHDLPVVRGVMKAIERSGLHEQLSDALARAKSGKTLKISVCGRPQKLKPDEPTVSYLLQPWELFARAYSQYIIVRSHERALLEELEAFRTNTPAWYPEQWEERDFMPIVEAMDRFLQDLGWRSP